MSDFYSSLANSNVGRTILKAINLPVPEELDRYNPSQPAFIKGNVLVGAAAGGRMAEVLASTLADSEATLFTPAGQSFPNASEFSEGKDGTTKFKGLVFDATGIENSTQLKAAYEFLHPVIRKVKASGRILILAQQPELCDSPLKATAQRALEGLVKAVAKEVKKGGNTQLVYVAPGAEAKAESSIRFFLSPKSAYVSAQIVRVNSNGSFSSEGYDWNKPLAGKVVLVTGASRGIGEAIAETIARDGATVVCLDIPPLAEDLEKVAARIGGKALAADITDAAAPQLIADTLKNDFGGADVIIHNAGVTRDKTLGGMPEHLWDMVIDINLSSEERINEALLANGGIKNGGSIVCVSSISGIAGNFGQTNYAASKAGVIGMVQSMAPILAEKNITINAVAPGFIETQMTAAIPFTIREAGRRMNSMSQGGLPVDVAETIAYFASPASAGVTGNIVRVCGQSLIGA